MNSKLQLNAENFDIFSQQGKDLVSTIIERITTIHDLPTDISVIEINIACLSHNDFSDDYRIHVYFNNNTDFYNYDIKTQVFEKMCFCPECGNNWCQTDIYGEHDLNIIKETCNSCYNIISSLNLLKSS